MTRKQIIELILNTAGFELKKFEIIRGSSLTGYEGEAYDKNGNFIEFATDSFEDVIREILEGIYNISDVKDSLILVKTKEAKQPLFLCFHTIHL